MGQKEIMGQLRSFIVENYLFGNDGGLKEADSFLEKGIIDSTGVLELVAFLQDTFGFVVEDSELVPDNLDSLANVTTYVSRKLNLGAGVTEPGESVMERRP